MVAKDVNSGEKNSGALFCEKGDCLKPVLRKKGGFEMIRNHRFFVFNDHLSNLIKAFGIGIIFLALALIMSRGAFAASISGTVFDSTGETPLTGVEIWVRAENGPVDYHAPINPANGTYTITGIPAGTYSLRTDNLEQSNYVNEWWTSGQSTYDPYAAEPITVSAGEDLTDIEFQLDLGGSISGTVFDSYGETPFEGLEIWVRAENGPVGYHASINPDNGIYKIWGVPAETYSLRTDNLEQSNYVNEWWTSGQSTYDPYAAEPITVSSGDELTGYDFQLDLGGSISGTVFDSNGETPFDGLEIWVRAENGPVGYHASINPDNGFYKILGVPAGTYSLRTDNLEQSNYVNEWWTSGQSTYDPYAAEPITVLSGDELTGYDFQLDLGGSISGTVFQENGVTPLEGVEIWVRALKGEACHDWEPGQYHASIDPNNGTYKIWGAPAGTYYLVSDNLGQSNYVTEWWASGGSTYDCDTAESITLSSGEDLTDIEFQLDLGGSISGTVFDSTGEITVTGVEMWVHALRGETCHEWQPGQYYAAINPEDGTYTIMAVPAGTYYLRTDNLGQSNYVNEWWASSNSTYECETAESIILSSGEELTDYDFQLDLDIDSDGMADGWEISHFGDLSHDGTVDSDNDGLSDLEEFERGTDPNDWDSDNDGVNDGQEISYGTDPNDPLSFTPPGTGGIRGVVKDEIDAPITSIQIEVRAISGDPCGDWHVVESVLSNPSDGTYAVVGLPPGNYYLRVDNMSQSNYLNEWWALPASVIDCGGAQTVAVSEGGMAAGKDFQLDLGGSISGYVTTTGSQGIANIQVTAYSSQCWESGPAGWSWTDGNGYYEFGGLPEGTYFVVSNCCGDPRSIYHPSEWWDGGEGTIDCEEAAPVTVVAGEATENINFRLEEFGVISGTVTDTNQNPVVGMTVRVQFGSCGGEHITGTLTDEYGNYTLSGVPPGEVYVNAYDYEGNLYYVLEWWNNDGGTIDCEVAAPVTIVAGQTAEDINFELQKGGAISGRVTDIFGNPMVWPVLFFTGCEKMPITGIWSRDDGNYVFSALPPGDVYVASFWPMVHIPLDLYYLEEWYDGNEGADDCDQAVPVQVTAGGSTPNINFALVADPERLSYFDLAVYDGILGAGFDVLPGFNRLLESATLTGPGGFTYPFDLENDVLQWLTECSYLDSWSREFSSGFQYGEYTLTLVFLDGAVKTYTKTLEPASPTAVDPGTMVPVVNPDGSVDFSWTPQSPDQYYQVRIYSSDMKTRYYRSDYMTTETNLHVSPQALRCLEIGQSYLWQVRTYDQTRLAVERGSNLPLDYNPTNLGGRTSWTGAQSFNGNLGLGFDVRPGSRDHLEQVTVTGPDGSQFSYTFDLTNDRYDSSTETRINRGWWKEFAQIYYGDYTFQIEFSDGHIETLPRTLAPAVVTPVNSATMSQVFYGNGDIKFSWDPTGGQRYRLSIRSLDQTREYYRSGYLYDESEITVWSRQLRALEQGHKFKWYLRAYDLGSNTMEQSDSVEFQYNPYAIQMPDTDGDGIWDIYDEDDDNDGIADPVDTEPKLYSNDFADAATTTGTIISRGDQVLTITDEPDPDGARISASIDGGPIKAKVSACGGAASYKLDAGNEVVVTCGSVETRVLSGPVEIDFLAADGTPATTTLDADYTLLFEPATFMFTAPSTNPDVIVVLVEGLEYSIAPGESERRIVDIKPGNYPNTINLDSKGVVPVAVLTAEDLDATTVNPDTVKFAGAVPISSTLKDVDGDGDMDILFHFNTQDLKKLDEESTEATLTGKTYGRQKIEGTDTVKIVH